MPTKSIWTTLVACLLLCGCAASAAHIIGYDITKNTMPLPELGSIYISAFTDERPEEERTGVKGKMLKFSSKDAHFNQPVAVAIQEILAEELSNSGFSIVEQEQAADYNISGSVRHFQAIMAPAKITFLPYLGSVSTLWAKDDFTIALSIYIKMSDRAENQVIDRVFDVSQDLDLPTGLLNLARYSRGFNYKLKLLDEALKDVMTQIRDEAVAYANQ